MLGLAIDDGNVYMNTRRSFFAAMSLSPLGASMLSAKPLPPIREKNNLPIFSKRIEIITDAYIALGLIHVGHALSQNELDYGHRVLLRIIADADHQPSERELVWLVARDMVAK